MSNFNSYRRARGGVPVWWTVVLAVMFFLVGCDGGGNGSGGDGGQTPSSAGSPPPASSTSRFFLSGDTPDTGCGASPAGARGSLCPTVRIPPNSTVQHFIFQDSPGSWVATLAQPMGGTGYTITLQLAMASGQSATGMAEILLQQAGADTSLFSSAVFTVSSSTYMPFTFTGDGNAAAGVPGDKLLVRIKCLSGCRANGLGVLLVNDRPAFIDVPHTAIQ